MRLAPLLSLAVAILAGCGSEDTVPFDDGIGVPAGEAELRQPYPEAPYGTKRLAIIENYRFLGWSNPRQAGYDAARLKAVSLADFYDPSGAKGLEYIVVTSTAVWCGVCQYEYDDFASGRVREYGERGVVFLGALFEDNDSNPARPEDLTLWGETFDVEFPFVLDPSFKLSSFFDREATPMTMVVDARTMQILWIELGWAADGPYSLWTFLDERLAE